MKTKYTAYFYWLLPVFVSIAFVIVIYFPVFFRGYWAVHGSDALNIHLPNNYAIAKVYLQGRLPLWNPNFNLGQPITDGFSTLFHPGLIFYLFFTPWLANTIEILLGLVLICLGAWYFLREQRLGVFPTAVGILIYVLSGPVFFLHSYHLSFMAFLALPWSFLFFHQHDRTGHPRWLWLAVALCIVAAQSLDLDILFYLYIGFIIDRLVCLPAHQRRIYVSIWTTLFLLSILTRLLIDLPFYEWLKHSSRLLHSYEGVLTPGFLNILTAMLINKWLILYPYNSSYFYFGPALIWLVLAGLVKFNKTDYAYRYFLYSLIIPSFYIIMRFLQFYYSSPLSSLDVWRSMFIFCLGLAMVASIGVKNILQNQRIQQWLALLFCLITIILAVWAIRYGMYLVSNYTILLVTAGGILIVVLQGEKGVRLLRIIGISIAVITTLLISVITDTLAWTRILYIWNLTEFNAVRRVPHIQCNMFMQNLPFYRLLNRTSDGKDGHWRVSVLGGPDNTTSIVGLKTLPNYTGFYNNAMENTLISDGLIQRSNTQPYWMRLENSNSYVLSLYGVRFLVCLSNSHPEYNDSGWIQRMDLSWPSHSIWENKYYLGRAYLVTPSGELKSGVKFLEDKPESVILQADVEDRDKLVLADLNYPGWQAFVDGKAVAIEVYHGCLRSVNLSKGVHIVSWRYNGRIQRIGIIISAIALFFLVVFLIILSTRKGKTNKEILGADG